MRFRVVTGNKARNPVAKAIARKKLHDIFLAMKVKVYLLQRGQDESQSLYGLLASMACVEAAVTMDHESDPDTMPVEVLRDVRVLRGALSALHQCLHSWQPESAVAVEQGIDAAERLNKVASSHNVCVAAEKLGLIS